MIRTSTMGFTVKDLLNAANKHYDERYLASYFDATNGKPRAGSGDTLAKFIVSEIRESFDWKFSRRQQVAATVDMLERAKQDIQSTIDGLREL